MPDPIGVDVGRLSAWLATELPEWRAPITVQLVAGGRSNLTYRIDGGPGHAAALRRPPLHGVLPTAHDVLREYRIISALAPTPVPVPTPLAACAELEVLGAPFYVMDFVEGHVLDEPARSEPLTEAVRHRSGLALAETLAALHAVDPDAVGLGDLARREDYVGRQLRRWLEQFDKVRTRDIPAVERTHELLAAHIPEQIGATVVHGDYRLGNTIVGDDGEIRAVLDWELCTLGDPLADVGYVLVTWPEDDREAVAVPAGNRAPGFASRAELVERYALASGRDVDHVDFYLALAYWRLACIIEGVYHRTLEGAQGEKGQEEIELLRRRAPILAELALEAASRAV